MNARIVAIANQKGGVGTATTAINLATALAVAGQRRILLVDLDPQANMTSGVGLKGQAPEDRTVYRAITADFEDAKSFVLQTPVPNLSLIAADRNLTGAEVELVSLPEREARLRQVLTPLREELDYIFIDTPPSLGPPTWNALV